MDFSSFFPGQSKANGNGKKTNNDEKTLKNEILELEKTFESLDMDRKTPTPRTGLFRTTSIAATAFMPQFLPYGNRPNRPGGGPNRTSLQSGGFFANPAPKTIKFSWEESSTPIAVDKNTDEWTYKQVHKYFVKVIASSSKYYTCRNGLE